MSIEKLSWDLGDGRILKLEYTNNLDLNIDDIVKIDINNLLGEYLTAPAFFNQIANVKSEIEYEVKKMKLSLEIEQDKLFEAIKEDFRKQKIKSSNPEIMAMVSIDKDVRSMKLNLINLERSLSILENLYWSMKEKCGKLDKMFGKISPEEFSKEIMEGQINNVSIRINKALIK